MKQAECKKPSCEAVVGVQAGEDRGLTWSDGAGDGATWKNQRYMDE